MLGVIVNKRDGEAVVILKSFRCAWGKCTFCPFFLESSNNLADVIKTNEKIIELLRKAVREHNITKITIFNGGSFFELPLKTILDLAELAQGKTIGIETRPEYLTINNVDKLMSLLKPRELEIRIGLEVWDEHIRNKVLNKGIPQKEVYRIIELRKHIKEKYGEKIKFIAYILFGIEGISQEAIIESIDKFNKTFDGVIALKYRKILPNHPNETHIPKELLKTIKDKCTKIDINEENEWTFNNKIHYIIQ